MIEFHLCYLDSMRKFHFCSASRGVRTRDSSSGHSAAGRLVAAACVRSASSGESVDRAVAPFSVAAPPISQSELRF